MIAAGLLNGHRGGDLVERQAVEQQFHVGQRGDGHAAFAELACGFRRICVVTIEGRHVKGDREARLSLRQQILEAFVGLFGGAEAGKHAHRPQFAAVAGGLDASGERIAPG